MAFTDKINALLPEMTKSQKIVATYCLNNINNCAFSTLEEMSRSIGVRTTTVIRFARQIGYSGFSDMQRSIQQDVINKVDLPERLGKLQQLSDTSNQLFLDSMRNDINNITNTFTNMDQALLEKVIESIIHAETVYVLGLRSSFALAHYTTSRLGQIRPHVRLIEASGMLFSEDFGGCNPKDVCVAFLFPRYSKTTSNLLTWLKKKHIPIILITSAQHDSVKQFSDTILPCYVTSLSYKNSFAAPVALINYMAASIAIRGNQEAMSQIKDTEEFLSMGYYLGL